ncbi:MAG: sulfatase-like hydrolase/transferase, partial [Planctomycetales bacterium]|nr:sulfatase-like hydrolase/transferase [Planctomycetales bacterium]
ILFLSDNGASPEIPGGAGYDRNGGTRDGRAALRERALIRRGDPGLLGSEESYTGIGPAWASAVNTPLRYWKAESYEGGCRTPLIVHWPRGLKRQPGSFVQQVGHVIDIAPTCYELAAVTPQQGSLSDGESLAGVLAGGELADDRFLFFDHQHGAGVRRGPWKASKIGENPWELFDVSHDPGETSNLAKRHPQRLQRFVSAWNQWRAEVEQKPTDRALRPGSHTGVAAGGN